jgi:hypothetical protein
LLASCHLTTASLILAGTCHAGAALLPSASFVLPGADGETVSHRVKLPENTDQEDCHVLLTDPQLS